MAGAIRQSIDIDALERYIESHVPDIKTPIDVKQVSARYGAIAVAEQYANASNSSVMANQTLPIN